MGRLPQPNPREVAAALKRAGFLERDCRGSHLRLFNPLTKRQTVVPIHGSIKRSLFKAIIKQAGLTEEDFRKFL